MERHRHNELLRGDRGAVLRLGRRADRPARAAAARALAREIADNTAPVSVALTRQMLWRVTGADHPMEAHKIDSRSIYSRGASADAREGVMSFLEKRPAHFTNKVSTDMPAFYPWWKPRKYE